ncbi:hypothetical protein IFM89_014921 [Coptis chinensis]|uniref:KIB1-4 beta-propeller domain-containing protein n=1 Tax=Coptis chinensis TaxID=261450 RepID=A0A835H4D8_9MAGN|nr:hypothetical protein IFM89_014921 [Coptis chinensis]
MVDWAGIPEELLSLICQRLDSFVEYLQFKVVCKPWRCVSYNYPLPQFPLLILPQEKTSSTCRRSFIGLTKGGEEFDKTKVYELDLPEIHRHRCVGAAGNWIVTVDMELDMHIFNLFSKVHMDLPPHSTIDTWPFEDPTKTRTQLRDLMVSKVFLTYPKNPSEDCIAVSLSKKLAIARPGDKTWTTIQNIPFVMDVIYFKQQLYGICANRKLYIVDIKSDPPKASEVNVSYSLIPGVARYLVEWSGELLQVLRHEFPKEVGGIKKLCTVAFDVFKLDFANNKWRPVKSLGQHALFLGINTSVSVLASVETIFKRNCIYFVEDDRMKYYGRNLDIEISFDMITGKPRLVEPIYLVEIQAPKQALERVYRVLNQRRGSSLGELQIQDPLEAGSVAATLVSEISRRKGLKEQMTPLSEFEDKL